MATNPAYSNAITGGGKSSTGVAGASPSLPAGTKVAFVAKNANMGPVALPGKPVVVPGNKILGSK